jgi:hypothetical protein
MSAPDTPDPDAVDEAVDEVPEVQGSKKYSYVYVTALFLTILGAIVGSVAFGIIDPSIQVTATVSIGWIVEYTALALAGLFVLFTLAQVLNIIGVSFVGGLVTAIARIADNYEIESTDVQDATDSNDGGNN